VLEHVADPEEFANEIHRILKPGGWFCARTPNRWGLVGIAGRLVPNSLHTLFLKRLQHNRKEEDIFPSVYRLNTYKALRRFFPEGIWKHCSFLANSEPPYVERSAIAMRLILLLWRVAPVGFYTNLNVFLRKQ
jgi:SAM-dependent methyltransferase